MRKRPLLVLSVPVLLSLWLSAPQSAIAQGREQRCRPVVDQQIAQVGLPQSRIKEIQISPRQRDIRDNLETVGYDGWVRLNDCPGSLIIGMDRGCNLQQVYVHGMCTVPGVKTFD